MKSRISIKADFVANTPYILIEDNPSEDTRDELIDEFFKKLGYTSSWCRVDFLYTDALSSNGRRVRITPITPEEMVEEATIMAKQVEINRENNKALKDN